MYYAYRLYMYYAYKTCIIYAYQICIMRIRYVLCVYDIMYMRVYNWCIWSAGTPEYVAKGGNGTDYCVANKAQVKASNAPATELIITPSPIVRTAVQVVPGDNPSESAQVMTCARKIRSLQAPLLPGVDPASEVAVAGFNDLYFNVQKCPSTEKPTEGRCVKRQARIPNCSCPTTCCAQLSVTARK